MELKPVLFIAGGVLMLAFCVWSYLGRSRAARWWSRPHGALFDSRNEQAIIVLWPACSVGAVLGGVDMLLGDIEKFGNVFASVSILAMMGLLWGILGIPIPRWMLPGWYREMKPPKRKRKQKQKQSPIDLWDQP